MCLFGYRSDRYVISGDFELETEHADVGTAPYEKGCQ